MQESLSWNPKYIYKMCKNNNCRNTSCSTMTTWTIMNDKRTLPGQTYLHSLLFIVIHGWKQTDKSHFRNQRELCANCGNVWLGDPRWHTSFRNVINPGSDKLTVVRFFDSVVTWCHVGILSTRAFRVWRVRSLKVSLFRSRLIFVWILLLIFDWTV